MIYIIRRIVLAGVGILCIAKCAFAQPENTARLTILSGGTVPFFFSSYNQFTGAPVGGITYTDYTTFSMEVVDLIAGAPVIDSWSLDVQAMAVSFVGDDPANTLPLSTLQMQATSFPSGCAGCVSTGIQTLPIFGTSVDLVSSGPTGVPPPSNQVSISYFCGTVAPLLGSPPDHYSLDIEYTLKPCVLGVCF